MNPIAVERLRTHLISIGRSRTRARDEVMRALHYLGRTRPRDVHMRLKHSGLDRVTIYRTIRFFREEGIILELPNGTIELSDQFRQHHHHFLCRQCGREVGFNDDRLENTMRSLATTLGVSLESHQVELSGLCRVCLAA
jgi:Fe2+ or Zn2+ uptake regulation protein